MLLRTWVSLVSACKAESTCQPNVSISTIDIALDTILGFIIRMMVVHAIFTGTVTLQDLVLDTSIGFTNEVLSIWLSEHSTVFAITKIITDLS
jgi:hypothetical protein